MNRFTSVFYGEGGLLSEHPEGRKGGFAREYMTKRSHLFVCVLLAVLLVCGAANAAVSAPISATIELSPAFLTSPGEVSVTVSVANVTNEDLTKPVTLFDSSSAQVMDFGTNGEVFLKAGETYTWTGTCQVSQNMLDMGLISYAFTYNKQISQHKISVLALL